MGFMDKKHNWALSKDEYWRLFFDRGDQERLKSFDACRGDYEGREPGYYDSIDRAFRWMIETAQDPLTPEYIEELHDCSVRSVKYFESERVGHEGDGIRQGFRDAGMEVHFGVRPDTATVKGFEELLKEAQAGGLLEGVFQYQVRNVSKEMVFTQELQQIIRAVNSDQDFKKMVPVLLSSRCCNAETIESLKENFYEVKKKMGQMVNVDNESCERLLDGFYELCMGNMAQMRMSFKAFEFHESYGDYMGQVFCSSQVHDRGALVEKVREIIEAYYRGQSEAGTDEARIKGLIEMIRRLEVLHPFSDGNLRTFGTLLFNRELMNKGFPPISFKDPNFFDATDIDTIYKQTIEAIEKVPAREAVAAEDAALTNHGVEDLSQGQAARPA